MEKEKIRGLRLNYKVWLETPDGKSVLGEGKWQLLKSIDETGSLKLAMKRMNYTYRKTWDNLRKIEQTLGFPVIKTVRGGSEGGHTSLTDEGRFILELFDRFQNDCDPKFRAACDQIVRELLES